MKPRAALILVCLLAFVLRVAGNGHGLIVFHADDPPPGVKGTVYTFYPDEREFAACFRSLGNSFAEYQASTIAGGMKIDAAAMKAVAKGFLTGRITFAPAWPLASLPIANYLIFFATLPVVAVKKALGLYPVLDSNAVFADAMMVGRFLSAIFGALLVVVVHRILALLSKRPEVIWTGTILAALMPLGVMLGHYASYNVIVAFLELAAIRYLVADHETSDPKALTRAAVCAGLAIATKTTAGALLPLIALSVAIRRDISPRDKFVRAVRALAIAGGTWLLALSYSLFTRFQDIVKTIVTQTDNITGKISGRTTPKGIVFENYYGTVLTFALSALVAYAAYVSIAFLVARARASRSHAVIAAYLLLWLGLSSFNGLNQASRMLVPSILLLISLCVMLDSLAARLGRPALLAASCLLIANASVDAGLTAHFFLQPDVRIEADRWIEENIPPGSTIGFFYEMIYNFQPTDLYTDYFWRAHRRYAYQPDLAMDRPIPDSVAFIVTNRMELLDENRELAPRIDAILAEQGFTRVAEFEPDLSLGPHRLAYESERFFLPNLFVSKIMIFARKR